MDNNAKRGRHLKAAPENEHPEQPEKKKKHVGRTVIIVIAAVVLVVLLAVFLIFRDLYSQMNTKPRTTPEPTAAPAAVIDATPEVTATPEPTPRPLTEEEKAELEERDKPDFDAGLEALIPVLAGRVPAHFHAHRADDIATAVRIAREFRLDYVLVHATEGYLVADILAREGVRVIVGPIISDRSKPELARLRVTNAAKLAQAGVPVAICTDHSELPIQYLPLSAALAAKEGMDPETALAAITLTAAEIGGIAHRVGSLTPGKDADLVLCSGHPFELNARIEAVFIDGHQVK